LTNELAAVMFDMDGLLVDTEPLWLQVEAEVMERLGGPAWTAQDQENLLGGSLDRTVAYLLGKAARPVPPEQVGRWMVDGIVSKVAAEGVVVRPGAATLLNQVTAAGVGTALVTSSQRRFMDAVLDATGFRFNVMVCAEDVAATKPDPEPYLLAAKLLAADPANCVVLEDSPNGVAAAAAAGCAVVAVPSLVEIPPAAGRVVVGSLRDVGLPALRALVALRVRRLARGRPVRVACPDSSAWYATMESDAGRRGCPHMTRSRGCRSAAA
jgi:HAD superfamily hydrolase (TIGR01509 family)